MKQVTRRMIAYAAAFIAAGGLTAGALIAGTARAAVENGMPAPAFAVRDAAGVERRLSEFAGRTIVLEWTNHDCPYVRKHYDGGNMQALQRQATADGVVWLSVISSAPGEQGHVTAAQAAALTESRAASPTAVLLDVDGAMGRAYGARTTPHMFVINATGRVVYQGAIDDRPSARASSLAGATNYVSAALADVAAGRPVATAQTTPYGCSVKYG